MRIRLAVILLLASGLAPGWETPGAYAAGPAAGQAVFNVRDFGATGLKAGNAQAAIQKAVDACAVSDGIVFLNNDVRSTAKPFVTGSGVKPGVVRILANIEK